MLPHKVSAQERTNSPAVAASPAEEGSLPLLQRLANYVANNPFKTVGGTAIPMYLTIFAYESTAEATRDLPFSQRLIHTRVYGQVRALRAALAANSRTAYSPTPSPTPRSSAFPWQAIAVMATIAVMTIVNAQTNRGGPFVAPGAKHDGSLERQYSTSAENYGRPSRSRFDMDYGGATPDSQYGECAPFL